MYAELNQEEEGRAVCVRVVEERVQLRRRVQRREVAQVPYSGAFPGTGLGF